MIEPDPASQPFPCPNQTVVYECTVDGYIGLAWILPTSDMTVLGFTAVTAIGATRNTSNGQFIATLNNRELVGDDSLLMTSTLLINPPLDEFNSSALTCTGAAAEGDRNGMNMTNVTLSGE